MAQAENFMIAPHPVIAFTPNFCRVSGRFCSAAERCRRSTGIEFERTFGATTTRERSRGTFSLATRLRQLKFFGKLQKGSFGILIAPLDGLFSFLRPRIDGIALFAESRILENQ